MPDLVLRSQGTGNLHAAHLNVATGTLTGLNGGASLDLLGNPGAGNWTVKAVADVNGDGRADILFQNSAGVAYAWAMKGGVIQQQFQLGTLDSSWEVKAVGDVNGDSRADLVWQNRFDGSIDIWEMNADKLLGEITGITLPTGSRIQLVDINADGNADLIWQQADGSLHYNLLANGQVVGSGALGTSPGSAWQLV